MNYVLNPMSTLMRVPICRMGNSAGIILPTSFLAMLRMGVGDEFSLAVEEGRLILVPAKLHARAGWTDAAALLAAIGDDGLVWPKFGNIGDDHLER